MFLGHNVFVEYVGSKENVTAEGKEKQEGYYNYFIGNDPAKHASLVGLYKEALVKNVYDGIDIRYYFDGGMLRYDYVVHPGADVSQIKLKLQGEYDAFIKGKDLVYTTRFGEVRLSDLHTYQGAKTVESRFEKRGNVWQIALGEYDKTKTLIIDPLIYSTFIGGNGGDNGYSIAIDGSGNAYITGNTTSTNYPTISGAYDPSFNGETDVFVTKLNSDGTALVYSTFIGGSGNDYGYSIAIDGSGNAYVTGATGSSNYPTISGADPSFNGIIDVFVTKLNSSGTALLYSTFLGGNFFDYSYSIALDGSGNAYIAGYAGSSDYPTTSGAYDQSYNGGDYDVIVTKLNSSGSALVYSTFIGGSSSDEGRSIAIDGSGNAYIAGYAGSSDYPTTSGAYDQSYNGGDYDVIVTKLNSSGSALVYSTFIGGSDWDEGRSIAIDGSGNAYITGYTRSTNYPTTSGAFDPSFNGNEDVFVTKLCFMLMAVGPASSTPVVCINTAIPTITHTTTGATGIGTPSGLPAGVNASFDNDTITISGTPTESGVFTYSIPLTGGCGNVFATGTITVDGCSGIDEADAKSFKIYPNPSTGSFTIQSERGGIFELLDMYGRVLNTYKTNTNTYTVKENLPSGIYLIREVESNVSLKLLIE